MQALRELETVSQSGHILRVVIGILVFGSVWVLVEATLGGYLHLVHFTYKGAITGGIAMSIMAAFVIIYRRPRLVFWPGVIAALFKPLSAPIYGQPIFAPFMANPASAILLESLAFTVVVSLLSKGFESSLKTRIAAGISAGYLSAILYAILASTIGMGNWTSWVFTERLTTALTDGTGPAIVGTSLLLLGQLVGTKLRPNFWQLMTARPKAFYASTIAITAFCWIGAAVAFASGLQRNCLFQASRVRARPVGLGRLMPVMQQERYFRRRKYWSYAVRRAATPRPWPRRYSRQRALQAPRAS